MHMTRLQRFLFSLALALFVGGVTLLVAQAQSEQPTATPDTTVAQPGYMGDGACSVCHKDIYDVWQNGSHGKAMSDPVFAEAWNAQSKPGACLVCHTTGYDPAAGKSLVDSVSCTSCHNQVPIDHPKANAPIDKSPDLCGKCHSDPRFATENWQLSAHYQRDMTCSVCHDPHAAGMKTIEGTTTTSTLDASDLCVNCHKDAMQNFPTSKHAEAGVTCVNCHLGYNVKDASNQSFSDIHKAPDHTFMPSLDTCNKCHADQMHAPGQAVAAAAIKAEELGGTATPEPTPVVSPIPPVVNEPDPVSPIGFAVMSGLLGLAGGMVLMPWLDRLYRHWNGK
jgi:predicted CXXCH cytochrome family protein